MTNLTWSSFFEKERQKPYFQELEQKVNNFYLEKKLFPKQEEMYQAFSSCSLQDTKIVILGQDPYHNDNQANGLAFAVNVNTKLPASLRNIFLEIKNEYGIDHLQDENYCTLEAWTKQGVLLLNTALTVIKHQANSCKDWGWTTFCFNCLEFLNEHKHNLCFVAFGNQALKTLSKLHLKNNNTILSVAHPSPLSAYRGFFRSNIFKKINHYLSSTNQLEIKW